ncbi:hypothetical protein WJX74_010422 [Apatococcus lobatus]|uniref:2-C-methyl-D-erythritol 2,4-cyclodiphosphate synthase n=1 Tax=Apatococcus lobatus TaxID=904363 RepID=A0AAW1Q668_9CHLO
MAAVANISSVVKATISVRRSHTKPNAALQASQRSSAAQRSRCMATAAGVPMSEAASPTLEWPPASNDPPVLPFRVGLGFDLHRLEEGDYKLIIGGVEIPHSRGCVAHSDGDVLLHTVTDAILGALCMPDIGQQFPDTDPKWKGAASDVFVRESVRLMEDRGYQLGNLDATIIAQKPKLSPFKEQIRNNLANLLGAHPSVINLKAKTHEGVDSLGENRSIACHAVVMLMRDPARPNTVFANGHSTAASA